MIKISIDTTVTPPLDGIAARVLNTCAMTLPASIRAMSREYERMSPNQPVSAVVERAEHGRDLCRSPFGLTAGADRSASRPPMHSTTGNAGTCCRCLSTCSASPGKQNPTMCPRSKIASPTLPWRHLHDHVHDHAGHELDKSRGTIAPTRIVVVSVSGVEQRACQDAELDVVTEHLHDRSAAAFREEAARHDARAVNVDTPQASSSSQKYCACRVCGFILPSATSAAIIISKAVAHVRQHDAVEQNEKRRHERVRVHRCRRPAD